MQVIQYKSPFVTLLQREVNCRVRYYSLKIYQTLFDEYLLEIRYGSIKNKSPTGSINSYYKQLEDALSASLQKVEEKLKRGYKKI